MKKYLLIVCLITWHYTLCQANLLPKLPKSAKSIEAFIPKQWIIKDTTIGDLNGDKINDIVLVIEPKSTFNKIQSDTNEIIGIQKALLILLKNKDTQNWALACVNSTFLVKNHNDEGLQYNKPTIKNNVLGIFVELLRAHIDYKFRLQNNNFYLIGATSIGVSAGQIDSWEINFSTKKAKHEWGKISDETLKLKWQKIKLISLKKLQDMTVPFDWEVLPDVYL